MSIVSDSFRTARIQKHVARPLKPRLQAKQAIIIGRPVRSFHRFYKDLPEDVQKEARQFARTAGVLDRVVIEAEYRRFERIAKYANYV